ncbi:MAG: glycosyltransferase family 39 protein [Flavobacteriaceae bacterium]|nr:glycosyltransferase family 39 protein [Flavobacteriaceae bacterium]
MKLKFIVFLSIAFLILISGLGSWGLTESSEARYAQISKEMLDSGNYIEPTELGIKHFHKPPITYYITTFGYQLFGINEFGARFFLQFSLILQLILVYLIAKLLYQKEVIAFAASIIYFSFPMVIISVRNLTTDAYLNTFILASLYFLIRYRSSQKPIFLYLFYLFLGLIFETKGPVGLIIPLTFIITTKIINQEKIQQNIHQYLGLILFLVVSSAWFILLINKNEGLLSYFVNHQLIDRVAVDNFKRGEPFYYYLILVPLMGIPLIFLFFKNFSSRFKQFYQQKTTEFSLLISIILFFVILSMSTSKLILYVLPIFSILSIIMAKHFYTIPEKWIRAFIRIYYVLFILIFLASTIIKFLPLNLNTNLYITFGLIMIIGILLIIISKNKKISNHIKLLYISALFVFTLIAESNLFFSYNEQTLNSVKPIAEYIKTQTHTRNKTIIVYDRLLPSLSFYLNQPIITVNNGNYNTQRETNFETSEHWKKYLINYKIKSERDLLLSISKNKNTFLIIKNNIIEPDTIKIIEKYFNDSKIFGKYKVYY